jgi:hypothetical protein
MYFKVENISFTLKSLNNSLTEAPVMVLAIQINSYWAASQGSELSVSLKPKSTIINHHATYLLKISFTKTLDRL